jgi:predicted metalloprotease
MRFRRGQKLDPGQVTDVRGSRSGPMSPGGLAVGGGGVGVAALVVFLLITLLSGGNGGLGQLGPLDDTQVGQSAVPSDVQQECRTSESANERDDCRIVGVVNSVQRFWSGVFQRSGKRYQDVNTVFFTDQVQTGCGFASSDVGPFYCPAVQDQLGVLDSIRGSRQGPESKAVRSELQADCYAGVWAANAVQTGLIEQIPKSDINDGLDAAAAIGDDRIQAQTQGQVNPETWTHGSSEQRRRWFSRGYEQGKPAACDTFAGSV